VSFLIGVLKLVFLGLLWLFIAVIAGIIRTDVFARSDKTRAPAASKTGEQSKTVPSDTGVSDPNPKRRGKHAKQAQLVVLDGPGKGDAVPLAGVVTVGRADDSTLDINDDYASGHHARFYRDDESWIVTDLGSTNGTIVNDLRITRPTRVGDGDIVRVGRTRICVEEP